MRACCPPQCLSSESVSLVSSVIIHFTVSFSFPSGLTHIIETRKVLDLRINLKPSYLIVPQTGFHHEKSNLLILDFGTFQVGVCTLLSALTGLVAH